MKLLLDQNLSYRMLEKLDIAFPGSEQVKRLGLDTVDDKAIWQYARDHDFVVVTQDSDFHEMAMLYGAPPKIIWLKCGNRPRWYVEGLLVKHQARIEAFGQDTESAVMEVY